MLFIIICTICFTRGLSIENFMTVLSNTHLIFLRRISRKSVRLEVIFLAPPYRNATQSLCPLSHNLPTKLDDFWAHANLKKLWELELNILVLVSPVSLFLDTIFESISKVFFFD